MVIILLFIMFLSVKKFAMKARALRPMKSQFTVYRSVYFMKILASAHDTIPSEAQCYSLCHSCNPRRLPHQQQLVCLQLQLAMKFIIRYQSMCSAAIIVTLLF